MFNSKLSIYLHNQYICSNKYLNNFSNHMIPCNYDKLPCTPVDGSLRKGWDDITKLWKQLFSKKEKNVLVFETYPGVYKEEIVAGLILLCPDIFIDMEDLYKEEEEVRCMTERYMTDDVLFGYISSLSVADYLDPGKVEKAIERIHACTGTVVIYGTGAALVCPEPDLLVYADMARWEIQQRFRRHEVKALGVDNRQDAVSLQYKRGYFNDWPVCDKYKRTLYEQVDFWVDTHQPGNPKMIDRDTFFEGIRKTANSPFRVVPFFDPAPWGTMDERGVWTGSGERKLWLVL